MPTKNTWGGARPGAGAPPGSKQPKKPPNLKRIRQQVSMPAWISVRLKLEKTNISKYIVDLILQDTGWNEPK